MSSIASYKELIVYKKAYKLAMDIFDITGKFPKEEKYSLTDQFRRSSRSITTSIAESWAKRRYEKYFINKLTDALSEQNETEVWLDFSRDCKYITPEEHDKLMKDYEEVRKILISMINNSDKWITKKEKHDDHDVLKHDLETYKH